MEKKLQCGLIVLIECAREIHTTLGTFLKAADSLPIWPEVKEIPEGTPEETAAAIALMQEAGIPVDAAEDPTDARDTAGDAAPTYEEVRKRLSEKSGEGGKAEVRELLTRHGLKRLSDVKDREGTEQARILRALFREAEGIGHA